MFPGDLLLMLSNSKNRKRNASTVSVDTTIINSHTNLEIPKSVRFDQPRKKRGIMKISEHKRKTINNQVLKNKPFLHFRLKKMNI